MLDFHTLRRMLARESAAAGLVTALVLLVAATALLLGLSLPILHVRWLLIFNERVSILGGIRALIENGEVLLALVLFAFSVALPFAKIVLLFALWAALRRGRQPPARLLALLAAIGRWAMLDVFVVALVILALKAEPLADAETAGALAPFICAIFLTAYGARRLHRASP
jgi:paraquat-inducible protein A